ASVAVRQRYGGHPAVRALRGLWSSAAPSRGAGRDGVPVAGGQLRDVPRDAGSVGHGAPAGRRAGSPLGRAGDHCGTSVVRQERLADMALDADWAERWVRRTAEAVADAKDELTELDRQIGDGDHGENLHRGFQAVVARLDDEASGRDAQDERNVGDVLKLVATTLMSTVGGASGPLYGTAYLRAAKVSDRPQIDPPAVVAVLEAAHEGVSSRGKATVGEKTMVDAWQAAVDAAEAAANDGGSEVDVLRAAAEAADTEIGRASGRERGESSEVARAR